MAGRRTAGSTRPARRCPALLDLATGALRQWPDSIHDPACSAGGIGTSFRADHFVFQATGCTARSWRLLPVPVPAADPYPAPDFEFAWGSSEVAEGLWLFSTSDWMLGTDCRTGACQSIPEWAWVGGSTEVLFSSAGDRAFLNHQPRVVDPRTLTVVARIEGIAWAYDGAFSPGADTLLVLGYDDDRATLLRAVRPADGTTLADIPLTGPDGTRLSPTEVAYDPVAPWIYVAGEVGDTLPRPALLVVDRGTLRPVALLRASADQAFDRFPYDGLVIVPAPLQGRVYVAWENHQYDPPTVPTGVYVFERVL